MTDYVFDYGDLAGLLSVSGGDNVFSRMTDQALVPAGPDGALSVSGGDGLSAGNGSMPPNIYIIPLSQAADTDITDGSVSAETVYTIWDKPLEKYSVSEGLLLIIAVLAAVAFIWCIVKGGFSWLNW